jgi:very-short-patch-repair endonuclease
VTSQDSPAYPRIECAPPRPCLHERRHDRARALGRAQTDAERRLWPAPRDRRRAGLKFRRQHVITGFIADLVCRERRLVIELDGGHHAVRTVEDQERERALRRAGDRVLRFWNNEVMGNLEGVLQRVVEAVEEWERGAAPSPRPRPSPLRGEGAGGRDESAGRRGG